MQESEPQLYRQSRGNLAIPRNDNLEPGASSWGLPLRDAIQACQNAQPSKRPSTEFLLRIRKEDALDDNIDPEPLDGVVDADTVG